MANLIKYKSIPKARRLCVFGNSTTGKTALVGQLARKYKLLWLDLDNKIDTLFNMPKELALTDEHLSNIEHVRIPDNSLNTSAFNTITKMFKEGKPGTICEQHGNWNCVSCRKLLDELLPIDLSNLVPDNNWIIVVDNGTQLSNSALNRVLLNSNIDLTTVKKEDKTSYAMWLAQGIMLDHILSAIMNGPNHVVITAHEIEAAGDDKLKKLYPSIGTKNFAAQVSKYFTNTIHTLKVNGKFKIESANDSSLTADIGGSINIDLMDKGTSICDFFDPGLAGSKVETIASVGLGKYASK